MKMKRIVKVVFGTVILLTVAGIFISFKGREIGNTMHSTLASTDRTLEGEETLKGEFIDLRKIDHFIHNLTSGTDLLLVEDLPQVLGFEPDIDVEFPIGDKSKRRIPQIIHQMWLTEETKNASIPHKFKDMVVEIIKHNQDWTYFFWTHESGSSFLRDRYPGLFKLYETNQQMVVRSDILRYVITYEYGGVYADLDTFSFRSLDTATWKYPCILAAEQYPQAVLETNRLYLLANGEFMCRPRHPFFKQILELLESKNSHVYADSDLGPFFITNQFQIYNQITGSLQNTVHKHRDGTNRPYMYTGSIPAEHEDGIYIPNTYYFLGSYVYYFDNLVKKRCTGSYKNRLIKRACDLVKLKGIERKRSKYAFLDHAYACSWCRKDKGPSEYVDVDTLSPNYKIYGK